jgi:hypothetical protein
MTTAQREHYARFLLWLIETDPPESAIERPTVNDLPRSH